MVDKTSRDIKMGQRYRHARKLKNLSAKQVCKALKVSESYIGRIERGEFSSIGKVVDFAIIYGVTPEYLAKGKESPSLVLSDGVRQKKVSYNKDYPLLAQWIPVIKWENIDVNILKSNELKMPERLVPSPPANCGINAFAVVMEGKSMEAPQGEVSFLEGDILIFDPELTPKSGDYVLVKEANKEANSDSAILRMYVKEPRGFILKSANPQYPITPCDKYVKIIACLVAKTTVFKR